MDLTRRNEQADIPEVDTVFHLAGRAHALSDSTHDINAIRAYTEANVKGTTAALHIARCAKAKHFVFFSSVKACGESSRECVDETILPKPTSAYGRSKLKAEALVLGQVLIPHRTVLRLSMVYGPNNKGNLGRMIHATAKGYFPPLPKIENRRSMVHVDDVAQAGMLVAERPEANGKIFFVTDGRPYETREIYEWVREAVGRGKYYWSIPMFALRALALVGDGIGSLGAGRFAFDSEVLKKLVGSAWYSSLRIEREIGYRPQRGLYESLPEIVASHGVMS